MGTIPAVVALAAGGAHSMAIDPEGRVWTWGRNAYGELGDGTTSPRLPPARVEGPTDVVTISAGPYQSLAVTATGAVWSWGSNLFGELGDGSLESRPLPTAISGAGGVWNVAAPRFTPGTGTYTDTVAVVVDSLTPGATIHYTTDGSVPDVTSPSVPSGGVVFVDQSLTLRAIALKAGQPDSLVTSAAYTLQVPTPTFSPAPGMYPPSPIVTLAVAATGVSVHVTVDGTVPTPASPLYTGPMTLGTTTTIRAKGVKAGWSDSALAVGTYTINVGMLAAPTASPAGGIYAADQTVTLAGPPGATIRYTTNGSTPNASSPVYAAPLLLAGATTLKAMAFQTDWVPSPVMTEAYAFRVATPVPSLSPGVYAPGQAVTLATATPGATIRYTLNGAVPTATDPALAPGAPLPLGNVTLTAAGFKTGYTASDVLTATYALSEDLTPGVVAAGAGHSLVLRADGTVWSWGANYSGQLGDGTTTGRTAPVMVHGLTGVLRSLAAGAAHSLAVRLDGTVWAWGAGSFGKLGDGTTTQRTLPTPVPGLTDVVAVAAGEHHSVALKADGTVWSWGANTNGQLGDGTTTQRLSPVPVTGLATVVAIAAGGSHTLAIDTSGAVWAWGANASGQLGDGTSTQRLVPTVVTAVTGAVQIAAGRYHSLARTAAGVVWAWGYNG